MYRSNVVRFAQKKEPSHGIILLSYVTFRWSFGWWFYKPLKTDIFANSYVNIKM